MELAEVRSLPHDFTEAMLEARLREWAGEYGGGRYDNLGYSSRNILQRLIEHGGFIPDSGGYRRVEFQTAADEIESAVNRMEREGWKVAAAVLRLDYFAPQLAMPTRLVALGRSGYHMARSTYYIRLGEAKAFVAGVLLRGTGV